MEFWHIETDYFALALFLVMLIKNKRNRQNTGVEYAAFFRVLLMSLFSVSWDILASITMECATNWWLYQIIVTIYVMTIPLLAAGWVCYAAILVADKDGEKFADPKAMTRQITLLTTPYLAFCAVAAFNPLTGWFFTLSSDMVYARGPLFFSVGLGLSVLYSLVGIFLVVRGYQKFYTKLDAFLLTLLFSGSALSIFVQIAHPGWLVINAAYAVSYVFCDMTIEEQRRNLLYQKIEQQNASLKQIAKEADAANRAKSDFLSRISHDIRTPLNGIMGMTYLACKQPNPPATQDCLNKIEVSSQFLLGLINDILDMSKAENNSIELRPEPYPVADFMEYLDSVIAPLCQQKHQKFSLKTMQVEDVVPLIDVLRFNQIVFNLLSNAVKYTPEGGSVSFSVYDELVSGHRERITLVVKDNGVGMSEEFQKVLFDPFTQETNSAAAENRGTGLGLAIVKKMVDLMGGTITVESRQRKGTTFTVVLAFDYVETSQLVWRQTRDSAVRDDSALAGKRVLLCEDNALNREIACALLKSKQMEVTTAENGQLGVERFAASEPFAFDTVLMDIRMPVLNGIDAARAIRKLPRPDAGTVPIYAMTADAFGDDVKKCREAGMNGHIAKPISPDLLFETLLRGVPPQQKNP